MSNRDEVGRGGWDSPGDAGSAKSKRGFGPYVSPELATKKRRYSSANALLGLTTPAAVANVQVNWMATVVFDQPIASVLTVNLQALTGSTSWFGSVHFWAATQLAAGALVQAAMVVEYGCGAFERRIVADAKSGSYQLPPATQVRVGFVAFKSNGSWLAADDFDASVAFSPGIIGAPARLTFTESLSIAAAATADVQVPAGARWVDVWDGSITTFGAGKPILTYSAGVGYGSGPIQRDYVSALFYPPWGPVETGAAAVAGTVAKVTNTGAATATMVVVRHWLEI